MKKTAFVLATIALLLVCFNVFAEQGGLMWTAICTNSSRTGGPCPDFCVASIQGENACGGICQSTPMFWDCESTGGQSGTLTECACID